MIRQLSWKEYLAELLVVIVGISIAFQVEEWAENRRQAQIHQTMLEGLHSEIEQNIAELQSFEPVRQEVLEAGRQLTRSLLALRNGEQQSLPNINNQLSYFASASTPDIQTAQLESYVRSDLDLTAEQKPQLLQLLTSLQVVRNQSTFYYIYRLERPLDVLLPVFSISERRISDMQAVRRNEFINTLVFATAAEQDQARVEKACLEMLLAVQQML